MKGTANADRKGAKREQYMKIEFERVLGVRR